MANGSLTKGAAAVAIVGGMLGAGVLAGNLIGSAAVKAEHIDQNTSRICKVEVICEKLATVDANRNTEMALVRKDINQIRIDMSEMLKLMEKIRR